MAKKPSLTESLQTASQATETPEEQPAPEKIATATSSRDGKKLIAGHFDPAVHRQLKQLSVDQDMTIQDLLGEALDDLFRKHGG